MISGPSESNEPPDLGNRVDSPGFNLSLGKAQIPSRPLFQPGAVFNSLGSSLVGFFYRGYSYTPGAEAATANTFPTSSAHPDIAKSTTSAGTPIAGDIFGALANRSANVAISSRSAAAAPSSSMKTLRQTCRQSASLPVRVAHHSPSRQSGDAFDRQTHRREIEQRRKSDASTRSLAQSGVPSMVVRIAHRSIGEIAFRVFHDIDEWLVRMAFQDIRIGFVVGVVSELRDANARTMLS
ncbi:hypothetical protein LJR257_004674 [Ensifer adhaerens]